jgi:hypothetical protein
MSEVHAGTRGCDATRERGNDPGAADWLYLAAAPIFAIMALLTGILGGSPDALCSVANASPLSGMVPMYVLMSAFHSPPWLRLITNWRRGACQARSGVLQIGQGCKELSGRTPAFISASRNLLEALDQPLALEAGQPLDPEQTI